MSDDYGLVIAALCGGLLGYYLGKLPDTWVSVITVAVIIVVLVWVLA